MGEVFGFQTYLGIPLLPALANVCSCRPTILRLELNIVVKTDNAFIIVMVKSCNGIFKKKAYTIFNGVTKLPLHKLFSFLCLVLHT